MRALRFPSLFALAALVLLPAAARGATESVAVMPLKAKGVAPATVEILDELLVQAVSSYSPHKVMSVADINAMLGRERMKQSLDCDNVTCAADIGGALGARFILSGSVAKLGSNIIVSLSLIDSTQQEVAARSKAKVQNNEDLYDAAIESAAAELFGVPVKAAAPPGSGSAPATASQPAAQPAAQPTAEAAIPVSQLGGQALRFGDPDEYPDNSSHWKGHLIGDAITIDRPITLRALAAIAKQTAAGFWLALYTDAGGRPGQLVVQTPSTPSRVGRIEIPVDATRLAAGSYWLMVACEGDLNFGQSSNETAFIRYITHDYAAPAPRTWPQQDSSYSGKAHNLYVVGVP